LRHFEHEITPLRVCFQIRSPSVTLMPTKPRPDGCVFVLEVLPPPRCPLRARDHASNGVFLCSKGCHLDRHFEHESTPSNGVFLCSKPCLRHDAHFEHESTPQRVCFRVRCPSSSLPFPTRPRRCLPVPFRSMRRGVAIPFSSLRFVLYCTNIELVFIIYLSGPP